jgi:hypothetical protein
LDASVFTTWERAPRIMRAEAPWTPVRLRKLQVLCHDRNCILRAGGLEHVAPLAVALRDAALQPLLSELEVIRADTQQPVVLDTLVDAALVRRLQSLSFEKCTPPAAAPLARLLAGNCVSRLEWCEIPTWSRCSTQPAQRWWPMRCAPARRSQH